MGKHFYRGAWSSLKNHSANMDTLIALGTGTAWLYSMVVVLAPHLVPEMAFSSLTVVTNANRLRLFKAQEH